MKGAEKVKRTTDHPEKRETTSRRALHEHPGHVDDTQMERMNAFRQAKPTRQDPAYEKILAKCKTESVEDLANTKILVPLQHTTMEEFKHWSRSTKHEDW